MAVMRSLLMVFPPNLEVLQFNNRATETPDFMDNLIAFCQVSSERNLMFREIEFHVDGFAETRQQLLSVLNGATKYIHNGGTLKVLTRHVLSDNEMQWLVDNGLQAAGSSTCIVGSENAEVKYEIFKGNWGQVSLTLGFCADGQ
uniref:Uncharacterized protein n=1 Tax=Panagrolaimus sp. JU765 TaxID=591449 RepID=A0AC34Q025_9BILA